MDHGAAALILGDEAEALLERPLVLPLAENV
jgi:hypothetical protein